MSKNPNTQEQPSVERRALSIEETAKTCGLSRATLYRLIADGKLATRKIGVRRVVPVGAIDALLNGGAAQ
jgi:excisionase family DNA binding protein